MKFLCIFVPRKKPQRNLSYEPIGTDREGNEIKLYDIIETDEEEVAEKSSPKRKLYRHFMKKSKRIIAAGTYYFKKCVTDSITEKNIRSGKLQDNLEFPVLMSHESKKWGCGETTEIFFMISKITYIHVTKFANTYFR